jgi:uncharacterized protein YecE (DUF72 family)
MAKSHIGTSGWNYKHWWNGEFYAKDLKPADWLAFYSKNFSTVEINTSFYRLPSEAAFQNWCTQVPPEFIFAVKASRFLTHIKRLKDPRGPLKLFFSRSKYLRDRMGPVLFQLPPRFKFDSERVHIFLEALRPYVRGRKIRCAIEVRDPTWLVPPVFDELRRYGIALCLADWRDMPVTGPVTADFVYVRRHYGKAAGGSYSKKELDEDITKIRNWMKRGLDVYVYFNNDMVGHAVRNAAYVRRALASGGSGRRKRAAYSATRSDFSRQL